MAKEDMMAAIREPNMSEVINEFGTATPEQIQPQAWVGVYLSEYIETL